MTAITTAARLLRVAADELKNAHTLGGDWGNEHEALDAYNEHMATATTLEHMARQCLAQIEEPANTWPAGLLERVKSALERIENNHCTRRIPADPTDPDLVLAEVRYLLEGKTPPFWVSKLPQGAAPAAVSQRGEYPQLPEGVMFIEQVGGDVIGRPTDYGFKHGRGIVHGAELFTSEQLRAYFDLGRQPSTAAPALEAPPAVAPQGEYPHEQMDAMALARYKVVPSHASMLWSHAVVAGDGAQQLYVGREVECQNMARKFAGAFLDGAFAFHSMAAAPTAQAAPALEAPAAPEVTAALDRMDALLDPKNKLLAVGDKSATAEASRADMALIRAALAAAPQAPNCTRCSGSGEDPEGYLTHGRGPDDHTVDGPCRECDGSGAAPQAPAAPTLGDERMAFEAWIKKDGGDLSTFGSGQNRHYNNSAVNNAWTGWSSRAALAAPAAPAVDASDTALLDAMERERIAVIPEFEGPWDAQIFGEDEAALACGSGVTPRKAIAEALASLEARKAHDAAQAKEGGAA